MKVLIIVFLVITSLGLFAQYDLTIEIIELPNNNGQILLQVYDYNQIKVKGIYGKIKNNECLIEIKDLKKGKYAFKYFHDENKNELLDTNWIGLPTEAYGFSNNAEGTFGPPAFEKWLFELKSNKKMICNPKF